MRILICKKTRPKHLFFDQPKPLPPKTPTTVTPTTHYPHHHHLTLFIFINTLPLFVPFKQIIIQQNEMAFLRTAAADLWKYAFASTPCTRTEKRCREEDVKTVGKEDEPVGKEDEPVDEEADEPVDKEDEPVDKEDAEENTYEPYTKRTRHGPFTSDEADDCELEREYEEIVEELVLDAELEELDEKDCGSHKYIGGPFQTVFPNED